MLALQLASLLPAAYGPVKGSVAALAFVSASCVGDLWRDPKWFIKEMLPGLQGAPTKGT